MKKAFQILTFLALSIDPTEKVGAQSIMRRYDVGGQNLSEQAFSVEINSNGAIVFSGSSFIEDSIQYGSKTMSLYIDQNGGPLDTNIVNIPLKATYAGWANSSFKRSNGGFGVGGGTSDGITHRPTLYLFDNTGVVEQVFEYGTTGETWIGRQGKQTPDGGYVICGQTSSSGTSQDGFLLKIDSLGAEEWVQTYGQSNLNEFLVSVGLAPNGGYYLGGQKMVNLANRDQWVILVDSTGNIIWEDAYGTQYDDIPNAHLESMADGNCVIASGWAQHSNGQVYKSGLMKIGSNGNTLWFNLYDGIAVATIFWAVKEITSNSDLIAAGQSLVLGGYHGTLLRTNSMGDSLWMRHYLYTDSIWTSGQGLFQDVEPTPDGGFIAVGTALAASNDPNDPPIYGQDTWVVKVDSMGCLVPGCDTVTGIESYATNLKDVLKIAPNPASHIVRLSWQLPTSVPLGVRSQWAQLSIVNAAGGLVSTQQLDLSQNNYELDVSALAAGIYYLHLVIDGVWVTGGKLICLPK